MSANIKAPFIRGISILLIILIALTAVPVSPAAAASSMMTGTSAVNIPVGVRVDWSELQNISTNDNNYVNILLPSGTYSNRLFISGFQLNIPDGATIEGVQVGLARKASNLGFIKDVAISLARSGDAVGTSKTSPFAWTNSEALELYGSATDKWGVTDWTPEDINAENFGVMVEVQNISGSKQSASIDYVRVTVTYSITPTITMDPLTVTYGESTALSATMSPAVSGKNISFTLGGAPACSAATDALGVASCVPSGAFMQNAGTYGGFIGATFSGGGDFKASSAVGDLIIAPRPITVTAASDTREYNGTNASTGIPTITSGSLLQGHTAEWSQSFEDKNVGVGKSITPTGNVNDGNSGGNYAITFAEGFGTITQRRIVVEAAVETRVYDGTSDSRGEPTITEGELAPGDTVDWSQSFDSKHTGERSIQPAGVIADGNNGENYYVIYTPVLGEITPLPITVSAVEHTKFYDGTTNSAKRPQVTDGTLMSGDLPDFWQGFDTQHVGVDKPIRAWGVVIDGNGGQNYQIIFEDTAGAITPRPITITAVSDEKPYDGTNGSGSLPEITEGALAEHDTLTLIQVFEDKHVGDLKTITPDVVVNDGNGGANYEVQVISVATGKITPRPITVTAKPDTKVYDGLPFSNGVPSITAGSLAPYDTATWVQEFKDEHAGTGKKITPSGKVQDGNNGNNYIVTFVDAIGTITPCPLTVSAVPDTKVYDGANNSSKDPEITDGELVIGDSGVWTQKFVDEHAGTSKTITPTGEIQDGNNGNNYAVTYQSVETGIITPRPITVGAENDTKIYDGTTGSAPEPQITSGSIVSDDVPSFYQVFATQNAGEDIVINLAGKVIDGNNGENYTVSTVPAKGTITQRPLTVTAVTDVKTFDGTITSTKDPQIISGTLAAGDSENFIQTFNNKNAGSSKTITPSGNVDDGNNGDNYAVTFVPVDTGEITRLAITVTADEVSKQFGEEDPELTFEVNPSLVYGDMVTGYLAREEGQSVGTYAVLIGTLSAGDNYELSFESANFIITKANQIISITQHAPAFAIQGTTFEVKAESSSGLPVTFSSSGACSYEGAFFTMKAGTGTCQVIIDQVGDSNYNPAPTVIEEVEAGEIIMLYVYIPVVQK